MNYITKADTWHGPIIRHQSKYIATRLSDVHLAKKNLASLYHRALVPPSIVSSVAEWQR